jgi:acetyl esterase/lipase
MLSYRARIIRKLLKVLVARTTYDSSRLPYHRKKFDRNLRLLFPVYQRVTIQDTKIAKVPVRRVKALKQPKRTIVYLHGGGFIIGSARSYGQHLARLAQMCDAEVVAIDYALAPEHVFPVALDQIQAVWSQLLVEGLVSSDVVLMGDSAGGNLALASALRFRDSEISLPACIVLLSPAIDGTFSGKSYSDNLDSEVMVNMTKLHLFVDSYLQGHDKKDPYASPVFADLRGLPPLLVHVASGELLRSDSETIIEHAKNEQLDAQLYIGEGLWHGWHMFASYVPEAKRSMQDLADYITAHI